MDIKNTDTQRFKHSPLLAQSWSMFKRFSVFCLNGFTQNVLPWVEAYIYQPLTNYFSQGSTPRPAALPPSPQKVLSEIRKEHSTSQEESEITSGNSLSKERLQCS